MILMIAYHCDHCHEAFNRGWDGATMAGGVIYIIVGLAQIRWGRK